MFTEDDIKKAQQFGQRLMQAKLDQSVGDWIEFNRLLIWYNGLVKKITDNVFEIKKVIEPDPIQEKKTKKSK